MRALKRASSSAVEAVGTALNEASDKDPDVESVVIMGQTLLSKVGIRWLLTEWLVSIWEICDLRQHFL